jgi:hypothetical protein
MLLDSNTSNQKTKIHDCTTKTSEIPKFRFALSNQLAQTIRKVPIKNVALQAVEDARQKLAERGDFIPVQLQNTIDDRTEGIINIHRTAYMDNTLSKREQHIREARKG